MCLPPPLLNLLLGWAGELNCPAHVQDAAAAVGDVGLSPQLWAALLRAHALLPALPEDAASSFRDDAQHEASTAGAPPPAALSLQVLHFVH